MVTCRITVKVENLSERRRLIAANAGNASLLLHELAYASAQLVHTELFDVVLYNNGNTFLIHRTEDAVELKKITKVRRTPIHSQKLIDCSGMLFG